MDLTRARSSRLAQAGLALALLTATAACGQSAADTGTAAAADGGSGSGDPDALVFAAVPAEESTDLEASYQPVIDLIEEETGLTVEFRQATDYAAVIEGQLSGQVHLAQYGPLSFVLAQTQGAQITPVGAFVDGADEEPGYQSYAITRPDTGITSLADMAGRTVCFVEPNSTSGYLYPSAGLIEAGVDPETGITPVFAGSHDASVLEVRSGRCDAGFAFDTMVETSLVESGDLAPGEVSTIWKSDTIPGSPLAMSTELSPELQAQLISLVQDEGNRDALLAAGLCSGECLIGDEDSWGYAAVDDAFYDPIREVCRITENETCTQG